MNTGFYKDLDTNFEQACYLCESEFSHEELLELLKNGNIPQKQIAALKFDYVNSENDARALVSVLTGCDGKIREAVSFRLKEFIPENPVFFKDYAHIIIDAIIDINGNICRNTIEAIKNLKQYNEFTNNFCKMIIDRANTLIEPIKSFDIQDGKYKINKEIFKLYWYLETISEFYEYIDIKDLIQLLNETKNIQEYTIREKTAKILSKFENNKELSLIKEELKNDKNYYVRRF